MDDPRVYLLDSTKPISEQSTEGIGGVIEQILGDLDLERQGACLYSSEDEYKQRIDRLELVVLCLSRHLYEVTMLANTLHKLGQKREEREKRNG